METGPPDSRSGSWTLRGMRPTSSSTTWTTVVTRDVEWENRWRRSLRRWWSERPRRSRRKHDHAVEHYAVHRRHRGAQSEPRSAKSAGDRGHRPARNRGRGQRGRYVVLVAFTEKPGQLPPGDQSHGSGDPPGGRPATGLARRRFMVARYQRRELDHARYRDRQPKRWRAVYG